MLRVSCIFAAIFAVSLSITGLIISMRTPRDDRNWEIGVSREPVFEQLSETRWRLRDMRAFTFHAGGEADMAWRDKTIDLNDLEEIWFFIEPFPWFDGAAHSFISFVFGGETNETIAISVEARKEEGEVYSGFNGLLNKFELIYLWSTEKDVLTRIVIGLDHDIYAYRLNIETPQARSLLAHFIRRTNALAQQPRFYNTITSNCTNELVKAANSALPNALPWHYSHILTGYSDARLNELGYLGDARAALSDIRAEAAAADAIRASASAPAGDFSAHWRTKLHPQTMPAPQPPAPR